jgi:hypothetical protein
MGIEPTFGPRARTPWGGAWQAAKLAAPPSRLLERGWPLSYVTVAEILLALAASPDGVVHIGQKGDAIRHVLHVAAEACELVDQAQAEREAALLCAAELRTLLDQAAGLLDAQPPPMQGGFWDGYLLAHRVRQVLRKEPLTAGCALQAELQAAREVRRAAMEFMAVKQTGDAARIDMYEQRLREAVVVETGQ